MSTLSDIDSVKVPELKILNTGSIKLAFYENSSSVAKALGKTALIGSLIALLFNKNVSTAASAGLTNAGELIKALSRSPAGKGTLQAFGQAVSTMACFSIAKNLTQYIAKKTKCDEETSEKIARRIAILLTILAAAGLSCKMQQGWKKQLGSTLILSAPILSAVVEEAKYQGEKVKNRLPF